MTSAESSLALTILGQRGQNAVRSEVLRACTSGKVSITAVKQSTWAPPQKECPLCSQTRTERGF